MRDGWEIKKLGDVCTKLTDGSHNPPKGIEHSNYVMLSSQNVFNDNIILDEVRYLQEDDFLREDKRTCVREGDVLLTIVGTVGRCAVFSGDMNITLQRSVAVLRPEECVVPRFLMHCLIAKNASLNEKAHGIAQKGIYLRQLSQVQLPVPPLSEQERIVAELDCLSSIIEKQKQQLKEYDTLAQSIFYDMFGDPITNEKGWEIKKLGAVCDIVCGQDYKAVQDDNGKYPIYGTGGIMGYASQYRCPANSIIIGRKGNINNPLFVDCEFWNVDTAFGVVPNTAELAPMYFFFFCKEYDFTKHDVSVTIPSLRRTDIIQINVPCPTLALQQEFASKVEAIEKQKAILKKSIEETELLFNSRMDYYFN